MKNRYFICDDYGRKHGHFQEICVSEVVAWIPGMTKGDLCRELELENYDTALPQWWLEDVAKLTGIHCQFDFVWSYMPDSYNQPLPITAQGRVILRIYNYIKKQEAEHGRS